MIGRTLDHYRVESKLGEGGMGVVYQAQDIHLGRVVAIKVLPVDKVADPARKQRFAQEAKAASGLNHPNIVTIYDIRSEDGTDFIVMEHIQGKTLGELIPANGMRPAQALKYAVQIADALAKAHGAGIIHRDLKPSNLMVTDEGRIKVLDFGLAKLLEAPGSSPGDTTLTARTFTEEGTIVGTTAYMSPEQAEGRTLDARSDIFSFGSVLYQMMTGRMPFKGDSKLSILAKILNEDPTPPAQLASSIPAELDRIILRCLRKDPARRYQTMADLKVALEDIVEDSGSGKQVRQAQSWRRWAWAALLPVLLIAGFFVWRTSRGRQDAEPLRATSLTTFPGLELGPSFSPDGNHVVFTWSGPKRDNKDIYVQQIGAGSPLPLTHHASDDYNPVWSPDGKQIAFLRSQGTAPTGLRNRELLVIAPLGGSERKLADIRSQDFYPFVAFLAWSPDSSSLVVTDSPGEGQPDALFVVSLETRQKRRLTNPQPPVLADTSPAISPDGRSLAFLRRTSTGSGELHLLPLSKGLLAGGEPKRLTTAALSADFPAWIPDGKEIVFSAKGSLWRLAVPGENTPTRIAYVGEDGVMPAISRSQPGKPARLVYVHSFVDFDFWRIETSAPGAPSTSAPTMAIGSTKMEYHIQLSPDGRRAVFTSGRSGDVELWISDLDGSNAVPLTTMGAVDTGCADWSPNGQSIAFCSTGDSEYDIYTIPVAGGRPRRLTEHPGIDICPRFSRDGKWIYFSSMRSGDYRIWKMPADGGNAVLVSPNQGGGGAVEGPDGSLYYNTVSTVGSLWRLPASGGNPVQVLDGIIWFNWCLIEKGIYYIDQLDGETRLQFLNFATRKSTTVARNLGEVTKGLSATPDGKTIFYTRMSSAADDLMLVENFR